MSGTKEIYYKFIFPNKSNIKMPSVLELLNDYPNNVMSYDELSSKNPIVKGYIDKYLGMPKYFDVRNYWDKVTSQAGGISLIVSHSPEVSYDSHHAWTKFTGDDHKTVYCSVVVSSGDFFYNFNLPEEVLAKSGLRDSIVSSRFHSNWYVKDSEVNEYKEKSDKNRVVQIGQEKRVFNKGYFQSKLNYSVQSGTTIPTKYTDLQEDLKKDFIDLEVTRRILYNYYNNWTDSIPSIDNIPTVVSGLGKNTVLSYEAPQEYVINRPMPIDYKLLRDALNNRDPYGDCETVLVMWVADSNPADVEDNDVSGLRALNWHQYAIPISVRCCFKEGGYNCKRFLVYYPYRDDTNTHRFHTRRNASYDNHTFKESLYLQGLIRYSSDYILAYKNISHSDSIYDIQRFLFNKCRDSFKALYIRRRFVNVSYAQSYYILVDSDKYDINTSNSGLKACIVQKNNNSAILVPANVIEEKDYIDWNLIEGWGRIGNTNPINSSWFITLFDKSSSLVSEQTGNLVLYNASNLKSSLHNLSSSFSWDDIYISSLGVSPYSWCNTDAQLYGINDLYLSLGILHNHIQIGSTQYGDANNNIVVGLKDVFDYAADDYHHFMYDSSSNTYRLVNHVDYAYTAYVMSIT